MTSTVDYIGYSENGIEDAIENALEQVGEYSRYEVIETLGAQERLEQRFYQVTLRTFKD